MNGRKQGLRVCTLDTVLLSALLVGRPPAEASAIDSVDPRLDQAPVVNMEYPESAERLTPPVGGRPGIEDPDSIGSLVQGYMGVPEDH